MAGGIMSIILGVRYFLRAGLCWVYGLGQWGKVFVGAARIISIILGGGRGVTQRRREPNLCAGAVSGSWAASPNVITDAAAKEMGLRLFTCGACFRACVRLVLGRGSREAGFIKGL